MEATNDTASAVECFNLEPEVVGFQEQDDQQAQVAPQAFEIVQIDPNKFHQSYVISNQDQQSYVISDQVEQPFILPNQLQQSFVITDQDTDCIYYTFEPGANIEFT